MYPSAELPQYAIFIEQQAKSLISFGHIVDVVIPTSKNTIEKIKYNNIVLRYIPFKFMERSIFYSYSAWRFIKSINKSDLDISKYDIIHIHACDTPIIMAFYKLARQYNKRIVLQFHGLNVFKNYGRNEDKAFLHNGLPIKKKLINMADRIICISKKVEDIILRECPYAKTSIAYNGVDTELFHAVDKKEKSLKKIICVANLIEIKGQKYLIEAFYNLSKTIADIRLIIVGRGQEEEKLKKLVEEYGLKGKVIFKGYVNYDRVAEMIGLSDIFVLPSFYEGFGCVYLEAMASKIATVACHGAGIDEIIKDGINGMLINPQSVESLEVCLKKLLLNNQYREKIAQAGYECVRKSYKWDDCARKLLKIYKEVLNG
ncbi:MAG: glycosyltransferase family 4 protein [Clostridiaceae bacterium]